MKALVLCGGIPQVALIEELKRRGIYTILVDMNPNVPARSYADEFYPVSAFDTEAIKILAKERNVDFVITACADQVLLVQAEVSEDLGLPCYINCETARRVSNKELMKQVFVDNDIPTAKYVILHPSDTKKIKGIRFPLVVKPIDSYSSRGVRKVQTTDELSEAFQEAINISRSHTVIVEEFVEGDQITVDAYVEEGEVHILAISNIYTIPNNDGFVINRSLYPARISKSIAEQVQIIVTSIARAFHLSNSPMLVQMITDGEKISVIEFSARTGGGPKFRLIKEVANFDIIGAIVDLTLGQKPHVTPYNHKGYLANEMVYAEPGIVDHLEGFDEMKREGIIHEYYQLKTKGISCNEIKSSGDRVAYYTIQADDYDEIKRLDSIANQHIKVIGSEGKDILRHDLTAVYTNEEKE